MRIFFRFDRPLQNSHETSTNQSTETSDHRCLCVYELDYLLRILVAVFGMCQGVIDVRIACYCSGLRCIVDGESAK